MKASDLIARLTTLVAEHGDQEINAVYDGDMFPVDDEVRPSFEHPTEPHDRPMFREDWEEFEEDLEEDEKNGPFVANRFTVEILR